MSDEKKKVNIEDLPVPLKELDKEEADNVTGGGITGMDPTNATPSAINPLNPGTIDIKNPSTINPLNPTKTFNP